MKRLISYLCILCWLLTAAPVTAFGETAIHDDRDLRKFPYPYQSMLAINSDIDGTTPLEFVVYHRYLNTTAATDYGTGLGLDIGDSFWVYTGAEPKIKGGSTGDDAIMSWFYGTDTKRPKSADLIKRFYRCGWIDSIHTYGDFSGGANKNCAVPTRQMAEAAWQALNEAGVRPSIWINHGDTGNRQNFGGYGLHSLMKYQQGDDPGSPAYHADLAIKNGIRYVWNSICTGPYGTQFPLYEITLRDGQKVWGYSRYTGYPTLAGWKWQWNPMNIPEILTAENLNRVVQNQQYAILSMHLGGLPGYFPFSKEGREALQRLKTYEDTGKILVARTSRLLDYALMQKYVKYTFASANGRTQIDIQSIDDPIFGAQVATLEKVRGLTFFVDNPTLTTISIGGKAVSTKELSANWENGKGVVGIRWFPKDTTNYAQYDLATAQPVLSRLAINNKVQTVQAYNINGNYYYKLRDLAKMVNGTASSFNVGWQPTEKIIQLTTKQPYAEASSQPAQAQGAAPDKSRIVVPNKTKVLLNGSPIELNGYLIDGSNYYKLRDLANLIEFSVDWDQTNKTVVIIADNGRNVGLRL